MSKSMSKLNKTELYALAKQLVSDNNSLKEENEKLDIKCKGCFGVHKQYEKLYEENENLKQDLTDECGKLHFAELSILDMTELAQEEDKKFNKSIKEYHKLMTACDKANDDFDFGIQDEKYNPLLLDDQEHIPHYIKQIREDNEKLKEENSRFQQLRKNYNELLVLGSKFNDYASGLTGTVSQNSTN